MREADPTSSQKVVWRSWCRLCAKDHPDNLNVYFKEEKTWTSDLAVAIGKYFWVNIKMDDELSNVLCKQCYALMEWLIEFSERVNRVQAMFSSLKQSTTQGDDVVYDALRVKHNLQADGWSHICLEPERIATSPAEITEEDAAAAAPADQFITYTDAEIIAEFEGEELLQDDVSTYEAYSVHDEETETEFENVEKLDSPEKGEEEDAPVIKEDHHTDEEFINEAVIEDGELQLEENCAGTIVMEVPQEQFNCELCSKAYKKPMAYKRHMVEVHGVMPGDIPSLECKHCLRSFPTKSQLLVHERSHVEASEKTDLACNLCDKTFKTVGAQKRHIAGIHENLKPFICDICGKALKTMTALKEHKLVHTDECPFECDVCHRRFKNKTRLNIHADIHTNNNYECNICGLKLNTRRTLNVHKLVHSDEKLYKCHLCSASFKRGKTLKSHLIIHTGTRPYKCNFCGRDFSNGSNCRAHKRKAHPEELKLEESRGIVHATLLPMLKELTETTHTESDKLRTEIIAAEESTEDDDGGAEVVIKDDVEQQQDDEIYMDEPELFEIVEEMECS